MSEKIKGDNFPFFLKILTWFLFLYILSCNSSTDSKLKELFTEIRDDEKGAFIANLEKENGIKYEEIENKGAYIPSMCYTKTIDENGVVHNPCYPCHTVGKLPNAMADTELQESYDFPTTMLENPYKNLFEDRSKEVNKISNDEMYTYIRKSNYLNDEGDIILYKKLPKNWKGYIPDCYFNFDEDGFDRNPKTGQYTGWRAYKYYPFQGTFWPTNGSTDDVIIRLPEYFMKNEKGEFDKKIWIANLNIIESFVKQADIVSNDYLDEKYISTDLDDDGYLGVTNKIKFKKHLTPVGKSKLLLNRGELQLEPGLFPKYTEFLHTVRYIDWDEENKQIKMSNRMKEVRYAIKEEWLSSFEIRALIEKKLEERHPSKSLNPEPQIEAFPGDYEKGMKNIYGWRYSGYIEDKWGNLRPQTNEETLFCMGCHDTIGATTDSTFSYVRKFEWGYWSKYGIKNVKEPIVEYQKYGKQNEYAFYLKNNKSGNEFRTNDEILKKFFNIYGSIKTDILEVLKNDISILLYPSKERAETLNKNYMVIVKNQSFTKGRDANTEPLDKSVHKSVQPKQSTGIKDTIF
ncbi:MAG: hypothetical protein N3C60_02835 [Calditerrivibrio sp.]|nr:hypothetical protein [Calditerrivibrio sp.]